MAPPSWAFDVENFLIPPDEELICSICQGVFNDPVRTACKHVFCKCCIIDCLKKHKQCPICRKALTESTLQDVALPIKNILLKQSMRCHNLEKGCQEIFSLESCESHVNTCLYEIIRCKNIPCEVKLMRKNMAVHESDCPYLCDQCKVCGLDVPRLLSDQHKCIDSLKKELDAVKRCLEEKSHEIKQLHAGLQSIEEFHEETTQIASSMEVSERVAEETSLAVEIELNPTVEDGPMVYDCIQNFLASCESRISLIEYGPEGFLRLHTQPRRNAVGMQNQSTSIESIQRELERLQEQVNNPQNRRSPRRRIFISVNPSLNQQPRAPLARRTSSRPMVVPIIYENTITFNSAPTYLTTSVDSSGGSTSRCNSNGFLPAFSSFGSNHMATNVSSTSSYVPTISVPAYGTQISNYLGESSSSYVYDLSVNGTQSGYTVLDTSSVSAAGSGSSISLTRQNSNRSSASHFLNGLNDPQNINVIFGPGGSITRYFPHGVRTRSIIPGSNISQSTNEEADIPACNSTR